MRNIKYLKEIYGEPKAQSDLLHDAIIIFTMNAAANYFNTTGRYMSEKEVDNISKLFYDRMMVENNLAHEWNQTS
jgi:hypothetical protein